MLCHSSKAVAWMNPSMLEAGGNPGSSLLRPQQARMQRNPGHGPAIRSASCGLRTQSSVTPAAAGIQPSSPTDQYGGRDWVPAAAGTTGGFGTQHFDPVISNPASSGEKSASIHGFRLALLLDVRRYAILSVESLPTRRRQNIRLQ